MAKEEETKKTKAQTVTGAVIPALGGLATSLGTAIPRLRRPKQSTTASQAALIAGSRLAGQMHGMGQQGFGATRALRGSAARRAAETATREAAGTAGRIGLAEQAQFENRKDARNQALQEYGQDLTGFVGDVSQGVVDAKAARAAEQQQAYDAEVAGTGYGSGAVGIQSFPNQGVMDQGVTQPMPTTTAAPVGDPGVSPMQLPEPQMQVPGAQQPGVQGPGQLQAPQLNALDAYRASLGLPPNPVMQLAPQLEYQLRVTNLAYDEAQRRGTMSPGVLAHLNRFLQMDPISNPMDIHGVDPGGLMEDM